MYSGWLLSEKSKLLLSKIFVQRHPDLIAHHITYMFGKDSIVPSEAVINVVGECYDDKVQCLVVEIDGSIVRPDSGIYHLTWSIDRAKGAKPVDSNKALEKCGITPLMETIRIYATPTKFKF